MAWTEIITCLIPLSPFFSRFSAKVILFMRHGEDLMMHCSSCACLQYVVNVYLHFSYRTFGPCWSFFQIVWRSTHRRPNLWFLFLTHWINYQMMTQEENWIGYQSSFQTMCTLSCRHSPETNTSAYRNCRY